MAISQDLRNQHTMAPPQSSIPPFNRRLILASYEKTQETPTLNELSINIL